MTAIRRIYLVILISAGAAFAGALYVVGLYSLASLIKSNPNAVVYILISLTVFVLFSAIIIFRTANARGVRMEEEVIRYNERYKALATFCDNGSLGVFGGSVAQFFANDGSNFLVTLGVLLGVAFLIAGWHIRGLIQSETVGA